MRLAVFGDTHGQNYQYRHEALNYDASIHVGDLAYGFPGQELDDESSSEFYVDNPNHHFIRGNHDHPGVSQQMAGWLPSGPVSVGGRLVFVVNGAWSIDQRFRTKGVDWWPDEEHSERELEDLVDQFQLLRPSIIVTHDGPLLTTYRMFLRGPTVPRSRKLLYLNRTAEALEAMRAAADWPFVWFFGHWHETRTITGDHPDQHFWCVGENDWKFLEV